jgi:hypothetical protein
VRRLPFTTLSIAASIVVSVATSASAQTWGRPRVPQSGACFYEHINFEGRYFCYRSGTSNGNVPRGLNDEISSIRIFGPAEVVVYKDSNFRGASRNFNASVSDLRSAGLNDRVSSLRVDDRRGGGRGVGGGPAWGRPPIPRAGACFYRDVNFRGDYFCASLGARAEVPPGTNDEISSVRVFGNAVLTVFRDINYQGSSRRFDRDVSDLRRSGWNDRISSYSIDRGR